MSLWWSCVNARRADDRVEYRGFHHPFLAILRELRSRHDFGRRSTHLCSLAAAAVRFRSRRITPSVFAKAKSNRHLQPIKSERQSFHQGRASFYWRTGRSSRDIHHHERSIQAHRLPTTPPHLCISTSGVI